MLVGLAIFMMTIQVACFLIFANSNTLLDGILMFCGDPKILSEHLGTQRSVFDIKSRRLPRSSKLENLDRVNTKILVNPIQ